jgi:hypothetical protein
MFAQSRLSSYVDQEMDLLAKIDWGQIERIYREGFPILLRQIDPSNPLSLTFWSDSNGGFNFDAYQSFEGGTMIRLGDRAGDWGGSWKDLELDGVFEEVAENLAEKADFDSLNVKMRTTIRAVAETLVAQNFGFDSGQIVHWKIQDEVNKTSHLTADRSLSLPE